MNNCVNLKRRMAIRYQPNNIKKMRVALFNKVMKDEIQKELDNEILTIMYDLSKNYNVNLSYPLIQLIDKQMSSKKDISQYYNPYQPLAK